MREITVVFREGVLLLCILPLIRRGPLTLQPRLRKGISGITTDMVRGRQEAAVCKGSGREGVCEREEDRRVKKGSSVYISCCSYIVFCGAVLGCSGLSDCVVRRYGGNMRV